MPYAILALDTKVVQKDGGYDSAKIFLREEKANVQEKSVQIF